MPPVALETRFPKRPLWLRLQGGSRRISVQVEVGKDGHVKNAKIVDSSGSDSFDREILRTAGAWIFTPGTRNGIAYDAKLTVSTRPGASRGEDQADSPGADSTGTTPPHATTPFDFSRIENVPKPRMQIRMTISQTGMVTDALIERAEDPEAAKAIIRAYKAVKWIPAKNAGIPTDYTFGITRR